MGKIFLNGKEMSIEELRKTLLGNTPPEKLYKNAINRLKK
jgi:hypothetical protein